MRRASSSRASPPGGAWRRRSSSCTSSRRPWTRRARPTTRARGRRCGLAPVCAPQQQPSGSGCASVQQQRLQEQRAGCQGCRCELRGIGAGCRSFQQARRLARPDLLHLLRAPPSLLACPVGVLRVRGGGRVQAGAAVRAQHHHQRRRPGRGGWQGRALSQGQRASPVGPRWAGGQSCRAAVGPRWAGGQSCRAALCTAPAPQRARPHASLYLDCQCPAARSQRPCIDLACPAQAHNRAYTRERPTRARTTGPPTAGV